MHPAVLAVIALVIGIIFGRASTRIHRFPVIDMENEKEKTAYVAKRMYEFLDEKLKPYCSTFEVKESNVRLILLDELVRGDARISPDYKELTSGEIRKALAE